MTQGDMPADESEPSTVPLDVDMMNDVLAGRTQMEISHSGGEYDTTVPTLSTDEFKAVVLIHQGFLLCAPFHPSVVITIPAMEVYHTVHWQCPQFTIQPFVKMLCDLHAVAFQPYLLQQFSVCYDLYVDLLNTVHGQVLTALGHDAPNWRALNVYPSCTYKLEGEPPLKFAMLRTMDGNDSLKHVEKWESEIIDNDRDARPGESIKRLDLRNGQGDYFIPRDKVEQWSKEAIDESLVHSRDGSDESPHSERWQNMVNDMSAKAWGIFDETGIFVCLCRHGFVLLITDMVCSGELAKYPLAIVDQLLDLYGDDLGIGYDVGCKFGTTVLQSPLGEHAYALRFSSLVGLFHGHAHQCLCQTLFLATYVLGIGLKDLEGYRFDTFQNLSAFLCNNYRQALDILQEHPILEDLMKWLDIQDESVFDSWLKEKEEYLTKLSKELPQETLEMEYFTALLDMYTLQASVDEAAHTWTVVTADMVNKQTHRTKTACWHLLEKCNNTLKMVQILEACLETQQWEIGYVKWLENEKHVKMHTYQRAIDNLECLVISHIFELTKMNMSHTGYKMRKHIGKALQTHLPCAILVYVRAFRKCPIGNRIWATPAGRATMDRYFKIKRAEEEINHLNIKIPHLLTYMADEDHYLQDQCLHLQDSKPALAHQISRYRLEQARFYDQHHICFARLCKRPGVTVSLTMGKVVGTRQEWNGSAVAEALAGDEQGASQIANDVPPSSNQFADDIEADDDHDHDDTEEQVEEQLIMLMDTFSV
ncbi:hypothetical protein EV421DRAFT_1907214 [Armillaria borealis]|uniref:CxC2-like cysteine cluster KDZ transposase-associated domain-containing protein n=1 Tax=Armillaria borealis TaxID=47425 RepID=A0AA39J856_9AGAR|nr:hypothetical protein EV421DRAFT_1907214 [Armillaria borealis]